MRKRECVYESVSCEKGIQKSGERSNKERKSERERERERERHRMATAPRRDQIRLTKANYLLAFYLF